MGSYVSHETYPSKNKDENDGFHYGAKFASKPFAQGALRYAFRGEITGNGPRVNQDCVTKVFKSGCDKQTVNWIPDWKTSKMAEKFAIEFNNNCLPDGNKQIKFIIPLIAKMKEISHYDLFWIYSSLYDETYLKPESYVAIEPFIEGKYEKFNSNGGWETKTSSIVHTFCHWTFCASGYNYVVCDLQGVEDQENFILTDPAIHSIKETYGQTDLGKAGMVAVLSKHNCNKMCHALNLKNPLSNVYLAGQRNTKYKYQLTEKEKQLNANKICKYFKPSTPIFEL